MTRTVVELQMEHTSNYKISLYRTN